MSGCKIEWIFSDRIEGRVTSVNPSQGIEGVRINYSGTKTGYVTTKKDGSYIIYANEGDYLLLKPEKTHYMFEPEDRSIVVKGQKDVNFQVVAFHDDFKDEDSGWLVDDKYGYYGYVAEEYEIITTNRLGVTSPIFTTAYYTVQATMTSYVGTGIYGLAFNLRTWANDYYIFCVDPDPYKDIREWKLVKHHNGTYITLYSGTHPYINDGTNILSIDQNGKQVRLYVYGGKVAEIEVDNPGIYNDLQVGLYAESKGGTFIARFDDFKLTSLGIRPIPQTGINNAARVHIEK